MIDRYLLSVSQFALTMPIGSLLQKNPLFNEDLPLEVLKALRTFCVRIPSKSFEYL